MANESPAYLAWVRILRCSVCSAEPCGGAHHAGSSGMGQRPHDRNAIPMCQQHHVNELHMATGWARGLTKANIRAWEADMVELTQRRATDVGWVFEPAGPVVRANGEKEEKVF